MPRVPPKHQTTHVKTTRDMRAQFRAKVHTKYASTSSSKPLIIEPMSPVLAPIEPQVDLTAVANNVQAIVDNVQTISQSFSDVLEIMSDAAASAALAAFKDPMTFYASADICAPVVHKNVVDAISVDASTFTSPETLSMFVQRTVETRMDRQMFWDKKTRCIVAVYVDYFEDNSFKSLMHIFFEKTIIYGMFHKFMSSMTRPGIDVTASAEGLFTPA